MLKTGGRRAVVFFGPPGSGKSTQALLLQEKCNFFYISWGKISRAIMAGDARYASSWETVHRHTVGNIPFPPGFIAEILKSEIRSALDEHPGKDLVLDGFPRRLGEAEELVQVLEGLSVDLFAVVQFSIGFETVFFRTRGRIFCETCGRFYNEVLPPRLPGLCDRDGAVLTKRGDDDRGMVKARYDGYMDESLDAYEFLAPRAQASFSIDADQKEILIFADLIRCLERKEKNSYKIYRRASETMLQTEYGIFQFIGYQNLVSYEHHLVLSVGNLAGGRRVPLRVHSSCITGDIFRSLKCDCGEQLAESLKYIQDRGYGAVIYLFQEGRGINILNKVKAYGLQDAGLDTSQANEALGLPPEMRSYGMVKDIVDDLKIKSIDLISNSPDKKHKLQDIGVCIESVIQIPSSVNRYNERYLDTKKELFGHQIIQV